MYMYIYIYIYMIIYIYICRVFCVQKISFHHMVYDMHIQRKGFCIQKYRRLHKTGSFPSGLWEASSKLAAIPTSPQAPHLCKAGQRY